MKNAVKGLIATGGLRFARWLTFGAAAQGTLTYSKDVAPILYNNCVSCHRPTMFAPMSLMTYEETRPWARAIKQRVVRREMPPWTADAPHGVFKNDPRLSQKDIDTIAAWVDAGAPRGDDRDLPAAPEVRRRLDDREAGRDLHDDRGVQGSGRWHDPVPVHPRPDAPDRRQVDPGDRVPSEQSGGRPPHHRERAAGGQRAERRADAGPRRASAASRRTCPAKPTTRASRGGCRRTPRSSCRCTTRPTARRRPIAPASA